MSDIKKKVVLSPNLRRRVEAKSIADNNSEIIDKLLSQLEANVENGTAINPRDVLEIVKSLIANNKKYQKYIDSVLVELEGRQ